MSATHRLYEFTLGAFFAISFPILINLWLSYTEKAADFDNWRYQAYLISPAILFFGVWRCWRLIGGDLQTQGSPVMLPMTFFFYVPYGSMILPWVYKFMALPVMIVASWVGEPHHQFVTSSFAGDEDTLRQFSLALLTGATVAFADKLVSE